MQLQLNKIQQGYCLGLLAALIWCGFILVSRLGGVSDLAHYDIIALRYTCCAIIVLPVWWFKLRFNLLHIKFFLLASVGGLAYALCTFQAFQLAPASHGALLLPGAMPLFMYLLAVFFAQTKLSVQKNLGISVISLGIVMLFLGHHQMDSNILKGDLLFLAGAFCWAVFSVLITYWQLSPWQVTISVSLITCIFYLPFYILFAPKNLSIELWPQILTQMVYQGYLATIVQMLMYVRAVEIIGAANMGSLMAFVPLITCIAAVFIFDEILSGWLSAGLCLVALGSFLNHSRRVHDHLHSKYFM